MGALKLTYWEEVPRLKVVRDFSFSIEKSCAGLYRYGFGGMEKNLDINGEGNDYTTQFRQYDARIGRWSSLDPLMAHYPNQSPFAGFNNNPIYFNDPTGLSGEVPTRKNETVKNGDTFWDLAKKSNGKYTVEDLKKWNPDVDPKKLKVGQKINTESIESFTKGVENFTNELYAKIERKVTSLKIREELSKQMFQKVKIDAIFTEGGIFESNVEAWHKLKGAQHEATIGAVGEGFVLAGALYKAYKAANGAKTIVYLAQTGEVVEYVGITDNFAVRAATHLRDKGIKIVPLLKNLSRSQARSVEQALIEIHQLGKNGGTLLNKINSIAKTNPVYAKSIKEGHKLLKKAGFIDGKFPVPK